MKNCPMIQEYHNCNRRPLTIQTDLTPKFPLEETSQNRHCPECSATEMGQFPICKMKWDLLRTPVTACTIHKNTFSAPFGIFYMRMYKSA